MIIYTKLYCVLHQLRAGDLHDTGALEVRELRFMFHYTSQKWMAEL